MNDLITLKIVLKLRVLLVSQKKKKKIANNFSHQ